MLCTNLFYWTTISGYELKVFITFDYEHTNYINCFISTVNKLFNYVNIDLRNYLLFAQMLYEINVRKLYIYSIQTDKHMKNSYLI